MSGGDVQWAVDHRVDVYLVPPSGNEMGKFSVNLYKKLVRSEKDKWDETNNVSLYKLKSDSMLFKSCEGGDPYYNKPQVEAAKKKVKIEEPK